MFVDRDRAVREEQFKDLRRQRELERLLPPQEKRPGWRAVMVRVVRAVGQVLWLPLRLLSRMRREEAPPPAYDQQVR